MIKGPVKKNNNSAHDPKHKSSSVKHSGCSVMTWPCMAASRACSLIFIGNVTQMAQRIQKKYIQSNWKEQPPAAKQCPRTH